MLRTARFSFTAALFALASAAAPSAFADAMPWFINGSTMMSGGGAVSGSFDYNADSGVYSLVDISVGADVGLGSPADNYTTANLVGGSNSTFLDLYDASLSEELQLYFLNPLTNAGGTVATGIHLLYGGNTDYEYPGSVPYNTSVSSTPEPGAGTLLAIGLVAVVAGSRRRQLAA